MVAAGIIPASSADAEDDNEGQKRGTMITRKKKNKKDKA